MSIFFWFSSAIKSILLTYSTTEGLLSDARERISRLVELHSLRVQCGFL